jgi:flagellar hook assembly protein FlgD
MSVPTSKNALYGFAGAAAALAALILVAVVLGGSGIAAAEQVSSHNVTVGENTTDIETVVAFNETAGDAGVNATIQVTDSNGTVVASDTLYATNGGNEISMFDVANEGISTGDYTVTVDATDSDGDTNTTGADYVNSVTVSAIEDTTDSDTSGGGGAIFGGSNKKIIAVLAAAGAALLLMRDGDN